MYFCSTGNRLFSATTADKQARDALIFGSTVASPSTDPDTDALPTLRTQQYDSQWLNQPNHVKSFEHEDKVYFLFSEIAVEYINCGKVRTRTSGINIRVPLRFMYDF